MFVCSEKSSYYPTASDGQYLNTNVFKYVFKYISVFKNVFLDTLQNRYLNTVFNYI